MDEQRARQIIQDRRALVSKIDDLVSQHEASLLQSQVAADILSGDLGELDELKGYRVQAWAIVVELAPLDPYEAPINEGAYLTLEPPGVSVAHAKGILSMGC